MLNVLSNLKGGIMNILENSRHAAANAAITGGKRVVLSMGGKGGVGKTSIMATLAEWFDANHIPVKLLDLDTECAKSLRF